MTIGTKIKLMNLLFENKEQIMTTEEDRFHLEDCIQYVTKPGLIVATVKGNSDDTLRQQPVGAIDNFRFMKVVDDDAILRCDKNNGKSYDMILNEYEAEKSKIIEQWKTSNPEKYNEIKSKYGESFVGLDIIQNDKKFTSKDTEDDGDIVKEEDVVKPEENVDQKLTDKPEKDNAENKVNKEEIAKIVKPSAKKLVEVVKKNEDKIVQNVGEVWDKAKEKGSNSRFFDEYDKLAKRIGLDEQNSELSQHQKTEITKWLQKMAADKKIPKEFIGTSDKDCARILGIPYSEVEKPLEELKTAKEQLEGDKGLVNESGLLTALGGVFSGLGTVLGWAWGLLSTIWHFLPYPAVTMPLLGISAYLFYKNSKKH